jgi:hypothetical protein
LLFLESDIEEFEENPDEYIRKDIEKSDSATRRRAAGDFLQALCIFFESQIIAIYSQYIDTMQKVKQFSKLLNIYFCFSRNIYKIQKKIG